MNPVNCNFNKVTVPMKDNYNFASPEPVNVHEDIVKPNLVGIPTLKF